MGEYSNGELLMVYRKRLGLTQSQFAKKYNVSQMMVSHWENGSRKIPAEITMLVNKHVRLPLFEAEIMRINRRRNGITLKELSERTGISKVTLIKREKIALLLKPTSL